MGEAKVKSVVVTANPHVLVLKTAGRLSGLDVAGITGGLVKLVGKGF